MKLIRALLVSIGLISGVAMLLLGIDCYLMTCPSNIEPQIVEVTSTTEYAQSFDAKIEVLENELDQAELGQEIRLVVTHEEVTSKANELIKKADLPAEVSDIIVNFSEGKILGLAKVELGMSVEVSAEGTIEIDELGKPYLVVEKTDIGRGAFIPLGLRHQIESLIPSEKTIADYLRELPIKLDDVVIGNGLLEITGRITAIETWEDLDKQWQSDQEEQSQEEPVPSSEEESDQPSAKETTPTPDTSGDLEDSEVIDEESENLDEEVELDKEEQSPDQPVPDLPPTEAAS